LFFKEDEILLNTYIGINKEKYRPILTYGCSCQYPPDFLWKEKKYKKRKMQITLNYTILGCIMN
jgi:hypothetical protein